MNQRQHAAVHPSGNLVLACVGDQSTHGQWLPATGRSRGFDLMLVYYGPGPERYRDECRWYLAKRGYKWPLVAAADRHFKDLLSRYERVWLPDDDIGGIDHDGVIAMFEEFAASGLPLGQPAVRAGVTAWDALRPIHGCRWHITNFVEVMCPLFTGGAFRGARHTFERSQSGWGLDFWWPRLLGERCVVLDSATVVHTRPPYTGDLYRRLRRAGVDPGVEMNHLFRDEGFAAFTPRVLERQAR